MIAQGVLRTAFWVWGKFLAPDENLTMEVGDLWGVLVRCTDWGIPFRHLCVVKTFFVRSRGEDELPFLPFHVPESPPEKQASSAPPPSGVFLPSYLFLPLADFATLFGGWAGQLNEPHRFATR